MMRAMLGVLLLAVSASASRAQGNAAAPAGAPQSGVVRGVITSRQTGEPLAFAIVKVEALGLEQFSNAQGRFYLTRVKPGNYRINIRQLGYQPANVDITVASNSGQDVKVQLDRIVTRLATYKVTEKQSCVAPGRPTIADGQQLVDVFEQMEQNAVRLRLLATEFPYLLSTERRILLHRADESDSLESAEMVTTPGQTAVRYEPGKLVRRVPRSRDYSLHVPTLLDFADPGFIKNHCFALAGLERDTTGSDESYVRVDFTASSKLDDSDVEGSVFLDSADYHLRRSEIRLTKVPGSLNGLGGVFVRTKFRDYVPGMPVVGLIEAVSELKPVRGQPFTFVRRSEQQIPIGILFTKQRPDSIPPPHN